MPLVGDHWHPFLTFRSGFSGCFRSSCALPPLNPQNGWLPKNENGEQRNSVQIFSVVCVVVVVVVLACYVLFIFIIGIHEHNESGADVGDGGARSTVQWNAADADETTTHRSLKSSGKLSETSVPDVDSNERVTVHRFQRFQQRTSITIRFFGSSVWKGEERGSLVGRSRGQGLLFNDWRHLIPLWPFGNRTLRMAFLFLFCTNTSLH